MKEMEAIVESEFSEVFVPLLMGLASYQDIYVVKKAKMDVQSNDLKPFEVATHCLQVINYIFLQIKRTRKSFVRGLFVSKNIFIKSRYILGTLKL